MSEPTVPAALRSFAEEPWPHLGAPPPPTRLIFDPRFTIELSPAPSQSVTCCLRTSEGELDDTIAAVRAAVREAGYTGNVWTVGPTARPAGLAALLRARGFQTVSRPPYEPALTVMALATAPPVPTAPGIEARLCANLDEFVDALRVAMDAFNEPPEAVDGWLAAAPSLWSRQDGEDFFTHIVFLDGKPAGMGFAASGPAGVMLSGSGVRESARGRGVYRALLAARWAHAVKIGRPGLVVHAGAMSRPILERCGFQALCGLELLEDTPLLSGG
jgi:GNAT superfamily N-acetyltransferase